MKATSYSVLESKKIFSLWFQKFKKQQKKNLQNFWTKLPENLKTYCPLLVNGGLYRRSYHSTLPEDFEQFFSLCFLTWNTLDSSTAALPVPFVEKNMGCNVSQSDYFIALVSINSLICDLKLLDKLHRNWSLILLNCC